MKKILFFCLPIFIFVLCGAILIFFGASDGNGQNFGGNGASGENLSGGSGGNGDIYLEIWQVDTFEGGTGSRRAYLERVCKAYLKSVNAKSKTARITAAVKQITPETAEDFFKNGVYPDIISFGAGLNLPYERLEKLDYSFGVVGEFGGECYAAVWAQGAYAYITRKGETDVNSVIVCEQEYANPMLAYKMSGEKMPENVIKLPAKEAVYEFYKRKNCALIGTQRDLYRLENKIETDVKPLSGYSDLYCCAAVVSSETGVAKERSEKIKAEKIKTAKLLLKYIVCTENPSAEAVGLLNYNGEANDKSAPIGRLNGYKPEFALSVFSSRGQIENLKKQTDDFADCEQNIKSALKRLK